MMFGFGADKSAPAPSPTPVAVELGYLGKLRSRADYLKHSADAREVTTLDACMKDWLVMQAGREESAPVPPQGLGFMTVGGLDRQSLCGYLFPSEDSHGRRYPFFYYARWSDVDLYFKPAPIFYGSWQLFQQCEAALAWPLACPEEVQLSPLRQDKWSRQSPSGKRLMSESMACMADFTLAHWLSHLAGGDPTLQCRLLAGCRTLIDQYRHSVTTRRAPVDLSLPLGTPELAPYSLLFWLHLLSGMDRSRLWRPDIVWTLDAAFGQLYVLSQPMTASRLENLFRDGAESAGADWMSVDGSDHQGWAEQLIEQPDSLLLDVAIRWSQIG
ncbi:TagF domain-containing protein [Saccharospirillum salsuginis]|nr:TagF domain-containing protein [Saccharospirillum salsuginis]